MPQTITKACLSEHDQRVLESIFDPLELTSAINGPQLINADTTIALIDNDDEYANTEDLQTSKQLEMEAVALAEQKRLAEALQKFSGALQLTPNRASIFNNRAQALRLAGDRDNEAMTDLNMAIEYGDKQFKTRCHALCQRGVLYRKQEQMELARADFEEAARLGSKFAKTQLVEINPFAALCNQMLRQAFEQLK